MAQPPGPIFFVCDAGSHGCVGRAIQSLGVELKEIGAPAVFLAGGGDGRESADAMMAGIAACAQVR